MNRIKFQNLIQSVTGRNLVIDTTDAELSHDKQYNVFVRFPITGIKSCFMWKTAKTEEKMLRSFITAFCSKYREPNPESYNYTYGGEVYTWDEKTPEQKEYCINHHRAHQYSREALMQQVSANFGKPDIIGALVQYGFYNTEYGIGIFAFWETPQVVTAINKMKDFLHTQGIPFANEFSDARWVFRFKINLTKEQHAAILNQFSTFNSVSAAA